MMPRRAKIYEVNCEHLLKWLPPAKRGLGRGSWRRVSIASWVDEVMPRVEELVAGIGELHRPRIEEHLHAYREVRRYRRAWRRADRIAAQAADKRLAERARSFALWCTSKEVEIIEANANNYPPCGVI